jgi:lipid-binding SYLF domain-containing protein
MHRAYRILPGLGLSLALAAAPLLAQSDEADRVREAAVVFDEIMSAPDQAVPRSILERAEAVAVFPSTVKGGFVVGVHRGRGIISARDPRSGTWSAPAFLTLTGGSLGAQIGGQAIDLVLVVMNRRGLENLLRNNFTVGADASVAAGPVGRDAEASTDIQLRAQILSYSRTRGLFAGVSLKGSAIRPDHDATGRFYGAPYRTRDIVLERLGGAPEPVVAWRDALNRYAGPLPADDELAPPLEPPS